MSPCPGLPVADATVVFTSGSTRVMARTLANGSFSADLPPGIYSIGVEGRRLFGNPSPPDVVVPAGPGRAPDPLDIVIDSGMR